MLFLLIVFLFAAILGVDLLGGLLRILMFFLVISLMWFIIKSGFYILAFFAVVYLGIKGIFYVYNLLFCSGKTHKKYRKVPYGDAEIIEMLD